ncbi:MAG: ABC transporter ATP-binding protein [candidate division Zixibacteria bacterium]|nr:ABC transporter ATP-binding protein [candidate division Zixibacteria bacterium]NIT53932.1 ABC transporter ATP-binding protein [candidate division Zixibacteria bacterium]NIW42375.1 ATP-binding cassette domain-containing protein [candidate division Zixibacteria bacterium]NIX55513.1 ATP-binding cassette domain-containing protein [candidate division Zixibacteria bacterium]
MQQRFVEVSGLKKYYNSLKAVDDVSFHIEKGEVFGLLGPNGAGKTTTVEIMEGLRRATSGEVRINGLDPRKNDFRLKQILGVQLQKSSMEERIKAREALQLYGSYYRKAIPADELLELVGLSDKKDSYYQNLSGGQQQRLSLAIALVNDPEMVFLDEPTTGLDAQARRSIWDIINKLRSEQKTILLTTHYIEEAEYLCDRVSIIDHGKIIAEGTPGELIDNSGISHHIEFKTENPVSDQTTRQLSEKHGNVTFEGGIYGMKSDQAGKPLIDLIKLLEKEGNELIDLHLERPTLEDVFIKLTGRRIRD